MSDDVELDEAAARHALERAARKLATDIDARILDPTRPVSAETETLYRGMPSMTLRLLRHAFRLDAEEATGDPLRAFCQGRIALIERILAERTAEPTA
jgi:hypothetical protein